MISPLLDFTYDGPHGRWEYNFLGRRDIATLSELRDDIERELKELRPDDPDREFMTGMLTQQLEQVKNYLADGDFPFEYTSPAADDDDFEDDGP